MKERVLLLIVSLCLAAGVLQAQTKQVEGIVTSAEDGQPVIGASVLVKVPHKAPSPTLTVSLY